MVQKLFQVIDQFLRILIEYFEGMVFVWTDILTWSVSPSIGAFKKYTMYQVSLFAVSTLNEVLHLSTATGYSTQGGQYDIFNI